jgi:arsenate reductase
MEKQNKRKVLFLCTGNSARSQMAEGLMRFLRGDEFEVYSAGTEPKCVHPLAIKVMGEIGVDISHQRSQHVDEFGQEAFDFIVTLCDSAAKTCPFFPGAGKRMHHSFPDPVAMEGTGEEKTEMFRDVREALKQFILSFPAHQKNCD